MKDAGTKSILIQSKSPPAFAHGTIPVVEHPFLILRKRDYTSLQARAARSPWKEQKEAAILFASTLVCRPLDGIRAWAEMLARIFSTTALAYILDPQNRRTYRDRIIEHLKMFDPDQTHNITTQMRQNTDKTLWIYAVPTGNAFFQGVLALDVIHDDIPTKQLREIEQMLRAGPAEYFLTTKLAWRQGALAAAAIWPIYERNAVVYRPIVEEWHMHTLAAISSDGVFNGGTGYACARWTLADREHKALFGELLVHIGLLPDWYNEPRLQNFQEWINGYAYAPFGTYWTFGDSGPTAFDSQSQPGPERAYRYSRLAAAYASKLAHNKMPYCGLSSYVLAEESYPSAQASPSRIFADGGAWLKETSLDSSSLSAAMWNLKKCHDLHSHKETNAICLAAYGEMLLRNGGYNGWNDPESGFSWSYINDRAIAANTVLFDYSVPESEREEQNPSAVNDHVKRQGDGITASLLTGSIDYAQGDSGEAIPNGRHLRNFLFVHPSDGAAGYYIVIDELISAAAESEAQIIWHPGSAIYVTTNENTEYDWNVHEFSPADVGLTIFLGTTPQSCALRNGVSANWGRGVVGKYLACTYPVPVFKSKTVITVLFPHNAKNPKADFFRQEVNGRDFVTIQQANVIDYVFDSSTSNKIKPAHNISCQAQAGVIRCTNLHHSTYVWLMNAVAFSSDWFELRSTAPITLLRQENKIYVTTKIDCIVTIQQPALLGIEPRGGLLISAESARMVIVPIRAGTHILDLHFVD